MSDYRRSIRLLRARPVKREVRFDPLAGTSSTRTQHETKNLGTVRALLGMAAGRFLPYVVGGCAWGKNTSSAASTITGLAGGTSRGATRAGTVYGSSEGYARPSDVLRELAVPDSFPFSTAR